MGFQKVGNSATHIDNVNLKQEFNIEPVVSRLDKIHKHLLRHNAVINIPDNVPNVEVKPEIRVDVPKRDITVASPAVNNINPSGKYIALGIWGAVIVKIAELVLRYWPEIEMML